MARSSSHSRSYMARKMKIATAQAKKEGYTSFKPGSPGARKREQIATAIEREGSVPKRSKPKRRKGY